MVWLLAPLLWIHITVMTFWMGSMIFATIFGGQQRIQAALENDERTRHLVPRLYTIYPAAILVGVITGILLGTVFGRIKSIGLLVSTPFGLTMAAAFLLVLVALAFGPSGPPNKPAWMTRRYVGELAIMGAFSCMVLMRYGL
jgi:putative copper export protein